jgi:outer membrane protein
MSNRNAIVRTALAAGLGLFTLQAQAADMAPTEAAPDIAADAELGPWKIRLRGLYVMTENEGKVDGVNNSGLSYSNTTIPELDINYYFNENIAAELILGTTYARIYGKGSIAGLGEIGKTWVLPDRKSVV